MKTATSILGIIFAITMVSCGGSGTTVIDASNLTYDPPQLIQGSASVYQTIKNVTPDGLIFAALSDDGFTSTTSIWTSPTASPTPLDESGTSFVNSRRQRLGQVVSGTSMKWAVADEGTDTWKPIVEASNSWIATINGKGEAFGCTDTPSNNRQIGSPFFADKDQNVHALTLPSGIQYVTTLGISDPGVMTGYWFAQTTPGSTIQGSIVWTSPDSTGALISGPAVSGTSFWLVSSINQTTGVITANNFDHGYFGSGYVPRGSTVAIPLKGDGTKALSAAANGMFVGVQKNGTDYSVIVWPNKDADPVALSSLYPSASTWVPSNPSSPQLFVLDNGDIVANGTLTEGSTQTTGIFYFKRK